MKALILKNTCRMDDHPAPLELVDLPQPTPETQEVLIKVLACGVCHTELDEIEGRMTPPELPIILGHQVVGTVTELGEHVSKHKLGDRIGVGWIFRSDGSEYENLSPNFRATGRDANGGYAEFMTVHEDYAFPIPDVFTDEQAAPLLCAGAIGYRALRLTNIRNGQPLGLMGFGGSAHLVIQLAKHRFPDSAVYVFARDKREREFAIELGAVWAGDTSQQSPQQLQAIIDTTPAWTPVVEAMKNLAPGGRLVINAIRKEDKDKVALLKLDYQNHLWLEKEIKSVANITAPDISEFLSVAAAMEIKTTVQRYSLADANLALKELKQGSLRGAKVLMIGNQT